jgi:hypothetical protein
MRAAPEIARCRDRCMIWIKLCRPEVGTVCTFQFGSEPVFPIHDCRKPIPTAQPAVSTITARFNRVFLRDGGAMNFIFYLH